MDNVIIVMGKMREKCLVLKDFFYKGEEYTFRTPRRRYNKSWSKGGQNGINFLKSVRNMAWFLWQESQYVCQMGRYL